MPANSTEGVSRGGGGRGSLNSLNPSRNGSQKLNGRAYNRFAAGATKTLSRTEVDHNLTVVWADGCVWAWPVLSTFKLRLQRQK